MVMAMAIEMGMAKTMRLVTGMGMEMGMEMGMGDGGGLESCLWWIRVSRRSFEAHLDRHNIGLWRTSRSKWIGDGFYALFSLLKTMENGREDRPSA